RKRSSAKKKDLIRHSIAVSSSSSAKSHAFWGAHAARVPQSAARRLRLTPESTQNAVYHILNGLGANTLSPSARLSAEPCHPLPATSFSIAFCTGADFATSCTRHALCRTTCTCLSSRPLAKRGQMVLQC